MCGKKPWFGVMLVEIRKVVYFFFFGSSFLATILAAIFASSRSSLFVCLFVSGVLNDGIIIRA